MKKPIRTAAFLLSALLLGTLSACLKKEEDPGALSNDMVRISTFSAQIDTVQWTAQEAGYAVAGTQLTVVGKRNSDTLVTDLSITVDGYHGRGTYLLDSSLNAAACTYGGLYTGLEYSAQSGQLTVSQDDSDRLSGNFVMVVHSPQGNALITDGKFTYYKRK